MKVHWFQIVSTGILALFLGLLVLTTFTAYKRRSGSTGQDMANIHKQRYNSSTPSQTENAP